MSCQMCNKFSFFPVGLIIFYILVSIKCAFLWKSFLALIKFLSSMISYIFLKSSLRWKSSFTVATFIWFLPSMNFQMVFKSTFNVKMLSYNMRICNFSPEYEISHVSWDYPLLWKLHHIFCIGVVSLQSELLHRFAYVFIWLFCIKDSFISLNWCVFSLAWVILWHKVFSNSTKHNHLFNTLKNLKTIISLLSKHVQW